MADHAAASIRKNGGKDGSLAAVCRNILAPRWDHGVPIPVYTKQVSRQPCQLNFDVAPPWFRGEKEPDELAAAARLVVWHIDTMFEQLELNANRLKLQFEAIDALDYTPSYEHAVNVLNERMAAFRRHRPTTQMRNKI